MTPGSAQANGPGPPGDRRLDEAALGEHPADSPAHWLSSGAVQAARATRPSGRSTRRVSRSAASGSTMSM